MMFRPISTLLSRQIFAIALVATALGAPAVAQAEREKLTIGITQFPSSFNPLIDSMMAKSYILGMTRRSITAYDQDWKLVCMLCVKLPTIENGLAEKRASNGFCRSRRRTTRPSS